MIYIVTIILFFNLWWALCQFKDIMSPPVLVGSGMFFSSFIASFYYEEWRLESMMLISAFILAFSPLFFTLFCLYLNRTKTYIDTQYLNKDFLFNRKKLNTLLILSISVGIISSMQTIIYYQSTFGDHLTFSETLFAARLNLMEGELSLPLFFKISDAFTGMVSYFSSWYISVYLLCHKKKDSSFYLFCFQLFVSVLIGLMTGSKGEALDPLFRFIVIYLFISAVFSPVRISRKIVIKTVLSITLLIYLFINLNTLIGRSDDAYNSSFDLVAEYCGAEIKNFDTFLQNQNRYKDNGNIGEQTFMLLYEDTGNKNVVYAGKFEFIDKYSLGNVYTQYMSFYKDFGFVGVVVMTALIAYISMTLYVNARMSILNKLKLNVSIFIYSSISICLFMSFFSSRFTERFFRIGMIRNIVIFSLAIYLFEHYLLKTQKR